MNLKDFRNNSTVVRSCCFTNLLLLCFAFWVDVISYCLINQFSIFTKSLFTQNIVNILGNIFSNLNPDIIANILNQKFYQFLFSSILETNSHSVMPLFDIVISSFQLYIFKYFLFKAKHVLPTRYYLNLGPNISDVSDDLVIILDDVDQINNIKYNISPFSA